MFCTKIIVIERYTRFSFNNTSQYSCGILSFYSKLLYYPLRFGIPPLLGYRIVFIIYVFSCMEAAAFHGKRKGVIGMKKYLAEVIGTFTLVFFGCGTAVVCGGFTGGVENGYLGVVAIALAFGLAIVASAYAIGPVSGCHVNPAVSLSMLLSKRLSAADFVGYVIAQVIGALAGSALLKFVILSSAALSPIDGIVQGLGQNGFAAASGLGLDLTGALVVEVVLTFVFILTILSVTSSDKTSHMAGIVIGLTLAFVHIIGIPLTGTSVNPARSLAPALFLGGTALSQVWVFIVAPFIGAFLAAVVYKVLMPSKTN